MFDEDVLKPSFPREILRSGRVYMAGVFRLLQSFFAFVVGWIFREEKVVVPCCGLELSFVYICWLSSWSTQTHSSSTFDFC